MPGRRLKVKATPPFEEYMVRVVAGPLQLGVEYRHFGDNAAEEANIGAGDAEVATMRRIQAGFGGFEARADRYMSLTVRRARNTSASTSSRGTPATHYLSPSGDYVDLLLFDEVVNGPMVPWTLGVQRTRLPAMLSEVGAGGLAERMETCDMERAIVEVERLVTLQVAQWISGRLARRALRCGRLPGRSDLDLRTESPSLSLGEAGSCLRDPLSNGAWPHRFRQRFAER